MVFEWHIGRKPAGGNDKSEWINNRTQLSDQERQDGMKNLIRYYAVRGQKGDYLGTLEITLDIAPIQAITGQKRIVS